jgi:hypothetical protein
MTLSQATKLYNQAAKEGLPAIVERDGIKYRVTLVDTNASKDQLLKLQQCTIKALKGEQYV